jgi:hypothetical protein
MLTLLDYILESLVNSKELIADMKFEKVNKDKIIDILDTDEFEHGKPLAEETDGYHGGIEGIVKNAINNYVIKYKDNIIGVFGCSNLYEHKAYGENRFHTLGKEVLTNENYNYLEFGNLIFNSLLNNHILQAYPKEDIYEETNTSSIIYKKIEQYFKDNVFDKLNSGRQFRLKQEDDLYKKTINSIINNIVLDKSNLLEVYKSKPNNHGEFFHYINDYKKSKESNEIFDLYKQLNKKISNLIVYVDYLQMSKDVKKKLDINQFSVIKVFFNKLLEMLKEQGFKYICAHGIDSKITNAYIKLGNFKRINKNVFGDYQCCHYVPRHFREDVREAYYNFVIRKI